MSTSGDDEFTERAAIAIMAGLLSNPNVVQYDQGVGWKLTNCTTSQLSLFAWHCARDLRVTKSMRGDER